MVLHREVQIALKAKKAFSLGTLLPDYMSRHARCGVQEAKGSLWTPPLRPQLNESCVRSLQVSNATACIIVACTCHACTAMAA